MAATILVVEDNEKSRRLINAAMVIRSDPSLKGISLIALTSFAMKGGKERFLEAGFDDYLLKAIDTRKLPEVVKKNPANRRSGGPEAGDP